MSSPGHPLPPASPAVAEPVKPTLFTPLPPEPSSRGKLLGAIVLIALVVLAAIALLLHRSRPDAVASPNVIAQVDPYANNLAFTELAMSESTSLSGGKSTFIDGHVKNSGPDTLTGITMQVLFRNDVALPPQIETLPLTLIRTHDPYVDTEPVSAAPLKSGDEAEFRLIFETVTGSWNQQMPDLHVIHVSKR